MLIVNTSPPNSTQPPIAPPYSSLSTNAQTPNNCQRIERLQQKNLVLQSALQNPLLEQNHLPQRTNNNRPSPTRQTTPTTTSRPKTTSIPDSTNNTSKPNKQKPSPKTHQTTHPPRPHPTPQTSTTPLSDTHLQPNLNTHSMISAFVSLSVFFPFLPGQNNGNNRISHRFAPENREFLQGRPAQTRSRW